MALEFNIVAEAPGSCLFQESPRKQEEARFREELYCFQDGCHSLGKVLEPHFPLVQAKGRAQGPGSLIAEVQNSCQLVSPGWGAVLWISCSWGGGLFLSRWARPHLPSSVVLSA